MLTINGNIQIPLSEFSFVYARSSGPGGQNVNKVNSKATLRWPVYLSTSLPEDVRERFLQKYRNRLTKSGEICISGERFRDQGRNVADCLSRLQAMVRSVAQPEKKRVVTRPTLASRRRRRRKKEAKSQKKQQRRHPRMDD